MNSRTMKLALVALIAMIAAGSMAFVRSGKGTEGGSGNESTNHGGCRGGRGGDMIHKIHKMVSKLDLSDEQRTRVEAIRTSFQSENATAIAQQEALHNQMREARRAGDNELMTKLRPQLQANMETLRAAQGRMIGEIKAVLTPEQLARLEVMKSGRRGGCGGGEDNKTKSPAAPEPTRPNIH